jgi:hypothetical protein
MVRRRAVMSAISIFKWDKTSFGIRSFILILITYQYEHAHAHTL